jgi:hypothetical protein
MEATQPTFSKARLQDNRNHFIFQPLFLSASMVINTLDFHKKILQQIIYPDLVYLIQNPQA